MTKALRIGFAAAALCALSAGCSPAIGDDCSSSVDCSVDGDRVCDQSQPGATAPFKAATLARAPKNQSALNGKDSTAPRKPGACSSAQVLRLPNRRRVRLRRRHDPRLLSAEGEPWRQSSKSRRRSTFLRCGPVFKTETKRHCPYSIRDVMAVVSFARII